MKRRSGARSGSCVNIDTTCSARLFSGSFESSIYLLSLICAIPESTTVLPAINSNFTHHISASLADGTVLAGQVAISHPSGPTAVPDATFHPSGNPHADLDRIEDANLPGSLPVLRGHHTVSKDDEEDLPARIERVWYINPYGHEIWPVANPKVLAAVAESEAVVYSFDRSRSSGNRIRVVRVVLFILSPVISLVVVIVICLSFF